MFINYRILSEDAKTYIMDLIYNLSNQWVGGSIWILTSEKNMRKIGKDVIDLIIAVARNNITNKPYIGAFLAEMTQNDSDPNLGLAEELRPLMIEISGDQDAVYYAEEWMNHELIVFGFYDEKYWANVKSHLKNLNK
jgi:hypothetical protein